MIVATRPEPTVRPPSRYQTGVLRYTNSDFLCDLCGKIRIFRCVRVVFWNFCYHGVITVFLVFGFEEVAEVCLNDDESQNNLKSIFVKLLTEITKYPIELQFLEKPEYKTGLYIDVCKEYIKDLNKEITNVRKNMPEKLKI